MLMVVRKMEWPAHEPLWKLEVLILQEYFLYYLTYAVDMNIPDLYVYHNIIESALCWDNNYNFCVNRLWCVFKKNML